MLLLLVALPWLATAQKGPPCQTPQQLEYSFWELDPNKREFHDRPVTFEAEGYQVYDGTKQRRFSREDRVNFDGSTPDEEKFEYFEDFRERYIYARSQKDRACKVYQMDPKRTWADHWVGVPPNATFDGVSNLGTYPIEVEQFIFQSNATYHNGCRGYEHVHLTARECAPITRHFYCDDTGFELKDYHNVVIGISDPDGHINPHSPDWSDCKRSEALPWDHNDASRAARKAGLAARPKRTARKAPIHRRLQGPPPHGPNGCSAPKQLEYSFWEADPNKREFNGQASDFMAKGFEIYDAENFRRFRREDIKLDPEGNNSTEDLFEYLDDYYRRTIFVRHRSTKLCKIYQMDGDRTFPMIGPAYEQGTVFRGKATVGAYPIELEEWEFSNNKTHHMGCDGFTWETYTEHECVPLFRHFYCDDKGFELRDYFNTVIGISDPDGHINPFSSHWSDCTH